MDAADASASSGVMVAFLPTFSDWCKQDLPHMTLVYAGTIDKLRPTDFNTLAKDTASIAMLSPSFALRVMGVEVFGDEDKVDVLSFLPTPELLAMRRMVESWNASQHPFNPHATIGPQGSAGIDIPKYVNFDRIMVGWGDERLTFWLKQR